MTEIEYRDFVYKTKDTMKAFRDLLPDIKNFFEKNNINITLETHYIIKSDTKELVPSYQVLQGKYIMNLTIPLERAHFSCCINIYIDQLFINTYKRTFYGTPTSKKIIENFYWLTRNRDEGYEGYLTFLDREIDHIDCDMIHVDLYYDSRIPPK